MKKTNILSIIFALVALVLAGLGTYGTMHYANNANADGEMYKQFIAFGYVFVGLMLITLILAIAKKNKAALFVMVAFTATSIYFVKKLSGGFEVDRAIFDVVSPADNTNVLTLLLFVGFVVCAILYLFKGTKYTNYFVIGYILLLVLTTIKFFPVIFNDWLFPSLVLGMISGYLSFTGFFLGNKKEENKQENQE